MNANLRRAPNCWQVFLRSSATGNFLVPIVHYTIPFAVGSSVHNIRLGVHDTQDCSPFTTGGIATTHPLIGILRVIDGRSLLTTRQRRLTGFVHLIGLQPSHPDSHVLPRSGIGGGLRGRRSFVGFLGSRTAGAIWIILVHLCWRVHSEKS